MLPDVHAVGDLEGPARQLGSSGLSLADVDRDGDQDILLANGDTFDDSLLKPYHGLAWLERKTTRLGPDAFALHRLAALPGPHGIVAADIDGDGDVDIVTGNMATTGPISSWVDVWENRRD